MRIDNDPYIDDQCHNRLEHVSVRDESPRGKHRTLKYDKVQKYLKVP